MQSTETQLLIVFVCRLEVTVTFMKAWEPDISKCRFCEKKLSYLLVCSVGLVKQNMKDLNKLLWTTLYKNGPICWGSRCANDLFYKNYDVVTTTVYRDKERAVDAFHRFLLSYECCRVDVAIFIIQTIDFKI